MSQQIVTANRLTDGVVVYRAARGWTALLDEAVAYSAEEASAELERVRGCHPSPVVGPYAVEVGPDKVPAKGRERIRALGPTFRPHPRRAEG